MDDRATDGGDDSGATPDETGDAENGAAPEAEDSATPEAEDGTNAEAEDDRRLWLVERTYTDKGLVSLVYATTDGEYAVRRQRSMNVLQRGEDVTAAITDDHGSLEPVEDESTREQYAAEAGRMADGHDPDEAV